MKSAAAFLVYLVVYVVVLCWFALVVWLLLPYTGIPYDPTYWQTFCLVVVAQYLTSTPTGTGTDP